MSKISIGRFVEEYMKAAKSGESIEGVAYKLDISARTAYNYLADMKKQGLDLEKLRAISGVLESVIAQSVAKPVVPRKHIVIPDSQVKPGVPLAHMEWIGEYVVEQKPDVIVHLGDFADMESLSQYERGTRKAEGKTYANDIRAAQNAMTKLTGRWGELGAEMHLMIGNHEDRIDRARNQDPKIWETISINDLEYDKFGWTVHDFLQPVNIDGVLYAHYFANHKSGKPLGGSISSRMGHIGQSFTMGHQQGYEVGVVKTTAGTKRGLVAGSAYLHDEDYRGKQGNNHWHGIIVKHEVLNGEYCLMEVSLDYLCRRYEGCELSEFKRKMGY